MRILHAEPCQQYLRVAIRHVIAIAIGVKKQIRRLQNEHAAMTERHSRAKIQAADEIFESMGAAIGVEIIANREAIGTFWPARRRLGNAVVFRAQILVHAHRLESGWGWILQILNHPHPPAMIKSDRKRFTNFRLV